MSGAGTKALLFDVFGTVEAEFERIEPEVM